MTTIPYDQVFFQESFPQLALSPNIDMYWDIATNYISDQTGFCYALQMSAAQQKWALNLMTAHLVQIANNIATGQTNGVTTNATVDKVSVSLLPPPVKSRFDFWLNQTVYGQQLLALLDVASVGGAYFSFYSPLAGYRQ